MGWLSILKAGAGMSAQIGGGVVVGGVLSSLLNPYLIKVQKQINSVQQEQIPNIEAVVEMHKRGLIDDSRFNLWGRELGYHSTIQHLFQDISYPTYSYDDIYQLMLINNQNTDWFRMMIEVNGYDSNKAHSYLDLMRGSPSIDQTASLYRRQLIDRDVYNRYLHQNGIADDVAEDIYKLTQSIYTINEAVTLYRRHWITEDRLLQIINQNGFNNDDLSNILHLTEYYPSASDIVRFAVREVYTPEIAEKYGLFEDYPEQYTEMALQAGLSEEFARDYWAAHWELPSITQGFEMLHRSVITNEEMDQLLRAKDIMPYWRERLTQISYNPYTRVDIRRMYAQGILDRDGVYRSYLDIGYDPEHAENLTRFTVGLEDPAVKELSKSEIIKSYKLGTLSRDESIARLMTLEYVQTEAEILLDTADLEQRNQAVNKAVQNYVDQYLKGYIDQSTLSASLDGLQLNYRRRDEILLEAESRQVSKIKSLTKAELLRAYKSELISEAELIQSLEIQGYTLPDIELLIQLNQPNSKGATEPS